MTSSLLWQQNREVDNTTFNMAAISLVTAACLDTIGPVAMVTASRAVLAAVLVVTRLSTIILLGCVVTTRVAVCRSSIGVRLKTQLNCSLNTVSYIVPTFRLPFYSFNLLLCQFTTKKNQQFCHP